MRNGLCGADVCSICVEWERLKVFMEKYKAKNLGFLVVSLAIVLTGCKTADTFKKESMTNISEWSDQLNTSIQSYTSESDTSESEKNAEPSSSKVSESENSVVASSYTAPDRFYFSDGSTVIDASAQKSLSILSAYLKSKAPEAQIRLEGHASTIEDGVEISREEALALSSVRAVAVKEYLVAVGIAANRIQTLAYGRERPVALGDSSAANSQNRRVEVSIK
jgi:peptidoglycan-associated lipoprotein